MSRKTMNKKTFLTVLLFCVLTLAFFVPQPSVHAAIIGDVFTGETIDGWISYARVGLYPPDTSGFPTVGDEGNELFVGQTYTGGVFLAYRSYVSFDTSTVPDDAEIVSLTLSLKTQSNYSITEFYVQVYGDSQPIWEDSLNVADWDCGTTFQTQWDSTNYVDETYVNFTISGEQINKDGKTQFEISSDREQADTQPSGHEYVTFHSADSTGNEPKLYVTYQIEDPQGSVQQSIGENWKFAGDWHDFKITYTYGGELDIARMAFSDLYESYALDFQSENTEYVEFNTQDRVLNNTWTIEFWGKSENMTFHKVVCGDSTNVYGYLLINEPLRQVSFEPSSANDKGAQIHYDAFGPIMEDMGWTHIAIVMDTPTMSLYVNGSYVASGDAIDAITDFNVEFIGHGYMGAPDREWDGKIDQFRILNRSLTQSELQYNMDHREPSDRQGMVLQVQFDEGTGTTLYDSSQYAVQIDFINTPEWTDGQITIDDDHWVIVEYDISNDVWSLMSGTEIAQIQTGEYEKIGNDYIITYNVFFKDSILDKLDVDVYGWSINTTGQIFAWDVFAADHFNIYNLGGQVTLESDGVAGRINGGDVFDLYADGADAWVRVNQIYRKIQHVKILTGFVVKDHSDVGDVYVRFGIDFVDPTTGNWNTGWNCLINVTEINADSSNAYAVLEIRWYYNDVQIGTTDVMTAMWEDKAFATPDGEYDGVRFHLDLWFNRGNASSIVAGRVGPYMYGLTKDDPAWWDWWGWWNTGAWKPLRVNATDSFLYTDLKDYTDTTVTSRALDLTRLWCNLTNVGANDDIFVMNYRTLDYSFAVGEMEGINSPPFPETLDPELPTGGGILAGIFNGLRELAKTVAAALTTGALLVWVSLVGFLDTAFGLAGWPNGFSLIMQWLADFVNWLVAGVGYVISMLTSMFLLMGSWLSLAITQFTDLASGFIDIYNVLVTIWTEAESGWLSISSWLFPLLTLFPLALFIWLLSAKDIEGVIGRIKMLWDLMSTVAGFLLQLASYAFQLITGIIELVPVAE